MSTSSHLCYNTKTSFEFRASFEHLRFFSQHFAITLFDNTEIDVILNFPSPATNTITPKGKSTETENSFPDHPISFSGEKSNWASE